jgi:hypothetical protein
VKRYQITPTLLSVAAGALVTCSLPRAFADNQSDMIATLQASGQLRLDCAVGKAWLDPTLWQGVDVDARENFARAVFDGCHETQESKSIIIYDAKSAKQLATYSPKSGLKVDQTTVHE